MAGQPPVLRLMNPLGHGSQVSFQLIRLLLTPLFKSQLLLSNSHLPFAHFSLPCLLSVASPEALDSPDPSLLAFTSCALCCLCLTLFRIFCSQCGVSGRGQRTGCTESNIQ